MTVKTIVGVGLFVAIGGLVVIERPPALLAGPVSAQPVSPSPSSPKQSARVTYWSGKKAATQIISAWRQDILGLGGTLELTEETPIKRERDDFSHWYSLRVSRNGGTAVPPVDITELFPSFFSLNAPGVFYEGSLTAIQIVASAEHTVYYVRASGLASGSGGATKSNDAILRLDASGLSVLQRLGPTLDSVRLGAAYWRSTSVAVHFEGPRGSTQRLFLVATETTSDAPKTSQFLWAKRLEASNNWDPKKISAKAADLTAKLPELMPR